MPPAARITDMHTCPMVTPGMPPIPHVGGPVVMGSPNVITGNLPQIGTATGSGTVAPSGALDFKMSATLSSNNVVGAVANQAMNTVGNYIGGFLHPNQKPAASNASRPIPLTITGTASSPTIRANVVAMFK